MKHRRTLIQASLILIVLYVLVCASARIFQDRLVYFPDGPPDTPPGFDGVPGTEVRLETADGLHLCAWLYAPPAGVSPLGAGVVYSHGNGGNVSQHQGRAVAFARMGYTVLLYDYRGYGSSAGRPDEEGTYLDAEAAYAWLRDEKKIDPARIVSFGASLGGAVAIELALRRQVAAVVVEDTFSSLVDMGAHIYPWMPVKLLARIRYESVRKVPHLEVPLMVLHSVEDEMVPFEQGKALYSAARDPKQFVTKSGGHNCGGFPTQKVICGRVETFIQDALEGRVESGYW